MNTIQIPEKGIYKEYAGALDEILPKDASLYREMPVYGRHEANFGGYVPQTGG